MNNYQSTSPQANILIADDAPNNLRLLFGMLAEQGSRVRPVPNGSRALATVQTELPDLILLDIEMPDIDGYEVCKRLKADERTRDIPVIFISGLNGPVDKVRAFSVGGIDYITKPFQVEEVLVRVKTHLGLRNLQKNLQQEITKRQQAEEELRELNQQLQETNQQLQRANVCKDKFFSIIAHDLRNPFNGLIALTEAIVEGIESYSKDFIKAKISRLHVSSKNVYSLLTNLLEWSRLQRGFIECEPKTLSCGYCRAKCSPLCLKC